MINSMAPAMTREGNQVSLRDSIMNIQRE